MVFKRFLLCDRFWAGALLFRTIVWAEPLVHDEKFASFSNQVLDFGLRRPGELGTLGSLRIA